jgi:hypothetical protein
MGSLLGKPSDRTSDLWRRDISIGQVSSWSWSIVLSLQLGSAGLRVQSLGVSKVSQSAAVALNNEISQQRSICDYLLLTPPMSRHGFFPPGTGRNTQNLNSSTSSGLLFCLESLSSVPCPARQSRQRIKSRLGTSPPPGTTRSQWPAGAIGQSHSKQLQIFSGQDSSHFQSSGLAVEDDSAGLMARSISR